VFVVVSRQALIDSRFSTVVCAPVYTRRDGLATQVEVGVDDGLKHASSIHCDALVSLPKSLLTDHVATLAAGRMLALDRALRVAGAGRVGWPGGSARRPRPVRLSLPATTPGQSPRRRRA
jgi:mRNA interferase MazF